MFYVIILYVFYFCLALSNGFDSHVRCYKQKEKFKLNYGLYHIEHVRFANTQIRHDGRHIRKSEEEPQQQEATTSSSTTTREGKTQQQQQLSPSAKKGAISDYVYRVAYLWCRFYSMPLA